MTSPKGKEENFGSGFPRVSWTNDDLLVLIDTYIKEKGFSPTVRELRDALQGAVGPNPSTSTIHKALVNLQQQGLITWLPASPRTLRVLKTRRSKS